MSTTARIGAAVTGLAVAGVSDMPDLSGDHFTWEGSCWEAVTDPDLDVATMSPSASSAAKEALTVRIVQSMSMATKKLVVTEEAILNHATLIGQTVVDDINIQGKLIGRDGTFTGTVDFENVNVTGTQLVNKLGANSISAEMVQGGSFVGKTFEGGLFVGGIIATSMMASTTGGLHLSTGTGLRAWDSSGKQTFHLSPSTGQVRASKSIVVSDDSGDRGVHLVPRTAGGDATAIYLSSNGRTDASSAAIITRFDIDGSEPIEIRGGGGSGVYTSGGVYNEGGPLSTDGDLIGDRDLIVGGWVKARGTPSTSQTPNGYFNPTSKVFAYRTSSRRFKKNIVDWNPEAHRVLALRPRQWQHHDPSNPDLPENNSGTWQVGFIAEEVDDLGLKGLVEYIGDGSGGWIPQTVNYERFAAAQQVILKKHEAEIAELRERIALLEQNQEPQ